MATQPLGEANQQLWYVFSIILPIFILSLILTSRDEELTRLLSV